MLYQLFGISDSGRKYLMLSVMAVSFLIYKYLL